MCCRLDSPFAEAAGQQRAKVAEHGLAADDENPGVHDGVEGVEAESCEVHVVTAERMDGVDKACNLTKERVKFRYSLC